jgi:hypothetical protein
MTKQSYFWLPVHGIYMDGDSAFLPLRGFIHIYGWDRAAWPRQPLITYIIVGNCAGLKISIMRGGIPAPKRLKVKDLNTGPKSDVCYRMPRSCFNQLNGNWT